MHPPLTPAQRVAIIRGQARRLLADAHTLGVDVNIQSPYNILVTDVRICPVKHPIPRSVAAPEKAPDGP